MGPTNRAGDEPTPSRTEILCIEPSSIVDERFSCYLCGTTFTFKHNLSRHIRSRHGGLIFNCEVCEKTFSRKDDLTHHMKVHSQKEIFSCAVCGKVFSEKRTMIRHRKTHSSQTCVKCMQVFPSTVSLTHHLKAHKSTPVKLTKTNDPPSSIDLRNPTSATCPPSGCKTALGGSYERHRAEGTDEDVDLHAFLRSQPHAELVEDAIQRMKGLKFFVSANILMVRPKNWITRGDQESRPYFTSRCHRVLEVTHIGELLEAAYEKIVNNMVQYLREGSGWIIGRVNFVDIVISTYKPMKGSSYIPLPPEISHTNGVVVNVRNNDQNCFLWAVLSAIHPVQQTPELLHHYLPYEHSMNLGNLTFPMSPDDIPVFEGLNNLYINLFGFMGGEIFPIYISNCNSKINLLLISNDITQHFCWISNFNQFMNLISSPTKGISDELAETVEDLLIPSLEWC